MNSVTKFYDLQAWQCARALRNDIAIFCKKLPVNEKFRLEDQVVRSSRSVTANIAEGFGCYHFQLSNRYYRIARGSLTETADHCICAFDSQYLSKERLQYFLEKIEECGRLINGLIRSQNKYAKEYK